MPQLVFSNGSVMSGAQPSFLTGIADLEIVQSPGGPLLLAATRAGGGVTGFSVGAQGLTETGRTALAEGLAMVGTPHLQPIMLGGQQHVVLAGLNHASLFSVTPAAGGDLGAVSWLGLGGLDARQVAGLAVGSGPYAFAALRDGRLSSVSIEAGDTLREVARMTPDAGHRVSDMLVMSRGGQDYLISAFATNDKISAFRVAANGALQQTDELGAANGLWVDGPGRMIAVSVGGADYVVVASALSSSLSVLRLETNGRLTAVDHVIDDLGTRFQGVSALDAIEIDGRTYLMAGGADDGLSLFSVLPGGQLLHHDSFADRVDTALTNVASVALAARGRQMQVFAAGEFDIGISQLTVALGAAGSVRMALAAGGVLSGTTGGDVLAGQGGADDLRAGGGDDILMDGAGSDTLTGGAGADIFVIARDGVTDLITDFQLGTDLLDLTRLTPHLTGSRMVVLSRPDGAEIYMDDEVLILRSADGRPLGYADIMDRALLEMSRLSLDQIDPSDLSLSATAGEAADNLIGTDGNDVLRGSGGNDRILGRAGSDRLLGDQGNDRLEGGDGNDTLEGGDGDDTLVGGADLDRLLGGAGDDHLLGGNHEDWLEGEDGNDMLEGGAGFDTLSGGDGNDTLDGGAQSDRLTGGAGHDRLLGGQGMDNLWGDAGNDTLLGGDDADRLYGGDGNDVLRGGINVGLSVDGLFGGNGDDLLFGDGGFDHLRGDAGNDTLDGGAQADNLYGDAGDDVLLGGDGFDRLFGGSGNDVLRGGDGPDALRGGAGFDTIEGGAGDDFLQGDFNADTFVFTDGFGQDTIADFDALSSYEKIDFRGVTAIADYPSLQHNHIFQAGNDVVIIAGPDRLTLLNIIIEDLGSDDFLF